MPSVLGIDLGGTKIDATLFDASSWKQLSHKRIDTHADESFDHVYDSMKTLVDELRSEDTSAVGIGIPGLVSQPDQQLLTVPNIKGGENFPLKKKLESHTGLSVRLDNDANCLTLAEALHGAGTGKKVVVGMTLGTGVGGGIVIEGTIFHGGHGFAGEIGHMLLQPGQPPFDTANKRGEVEQFFSGTAMGKRCEAAGKPEDYLEGAVCEFMRPDVFREIAWTCVNLTHLLDPDVIVFGGSAGRSLKPHLSSIEKEMTQWILPSTPLPTLAIATVENGATLGAALLTQ